MQIQLFNNPDFGQIRVVMIDGEPRFVASDIAQVLEIKNIRQNLAELDDDEKGVCSIYTQGGYQNMSVVNEPGLYRLISSSRKPEAKKFQRWVYHEVLPTIRKTGSYSLNPQSTLLKAASEIDPLSAILQSTFAVKRGIALSQAIDVVGNNYNLNLDSLKKLLPSADHETGYLNATQIGQKFGGHNAKVINGMLFDVGLQYRDGKNWRLTEAGKNYGEEMPYTRNGHSGYQIRWNESVLGVLNGN